MTRRMRSYNKLAHGSSVICRYGSVDNVRYNVWSSDNYNGEGQTLITRAYIPTTIQRYTSIIFFFMDLRSLKSSFPARYCGSGFDKIVLHVLDLQIKFNFVSGRCRCPYNFKMYRKDSTICAQLKFIQANLVLSLQNTSNPIYA